jgi:enolase
MHKIILGVFISLIFVSSLADAKSSKKKSGKDKHGAIVEQLEMNTAAIDEIQQAMEEMGDVQAASIDPILLAVDCSNGDSISAELARLARTIHECRH